MAQAFTKTSCIWTTTDNTLSASSDLKERGNNEESEREGGIWRGRREGDGDGEGRIEEWGGRGNGKKRRKRGGDFGEEWGEGEEAREGKIEVGVC
jgi:hypothetical protein